MYIRRWNKSIANLIALLYITVHCCIRHCCIMLWVRCGMNTSHITTKKQHKAYQNQFTSNKYHYELNHCHVKCSIDVITWCSFSWDDARDCKKKNPNILHVGHDTDIHHKASYTLSKIMSSVFSETAGSFSLYNH